MLPRRGWCLFAILGSSNILQHRGSVERVRAHQAGSSRDTERHFHEWETVPAGSIRIAQRVWLLTLRATFRLSTPI